MQMFNAFVRSKLEYASQVWNPFYKKDIDAIEKVQRRFTKRIPGYSNFSYVERLNKLEAIPLELRRLQLDLLFTFKLRRGGMGVAFSRYFQSKASRTRGHLFQIYPQRSNKDIRKHFFSCRIVEAWNKLPEHIVKSRTISQFKKLLCTKEVTDILWPLLRGRGL